MLDHHLGSLHCGNCFLVQYHSSRISCQRVCRGIHLCRRRSRSCIHVASWHGGKAWFRDINVRGKSTKFLSNKSPSPIKLEAKRVFIKPQVLLDRSWKSSGSRGSWVSHNVSCYAQLRDQIHLPITASDTHCSPSRYMWTHDKSSKNIPEPLSSTIQREWLPRPATRALTLFNDNFTAIILP